MSFPEFIFLWSLFPFLKDKLMINTLSQICDRIILKIIEHDV